MNRNLVRQNSIVLKIGELIDEGIDLHLEELDIRLKADENKQKLSSTLSQLDIFEEIDRKVESEKVYTNDNGDVLPF